MKNIIILVLFASIFTCCSTRPHFVIENETKNEIKIELVLDSLNLKETVAHFIAEKGDHYSGYSSGIDSIKKALTPDILYMYIYDSLQINSFFIKTSPNMDEFGIRPLDVTDEQIQNRTVFVNLNQNIFDYYHYDSSLVKKIINENTITLFIPADNKFMRVCSSCGDCSCSIEESFPNAKEVRVVISKDNVIILSKANFKHIMKNKKVESQSGSYILEIE